MASEDIYGNKEKYELLVANIETFTLKPEERSREGKKGGKGKKGKYFCKNRKNMSSFPHLFRHFEKEDNSYVLRIRRIQSLKLLLFLTEKHLTDIEEEGDREEIDNIVIGARKCYSDSSVSFFIADLKRIWKTLFPAKDTLGRIDETQVPYVVRHLSRKIDKSRQKMREDRLTVAEYLRIIDTFSDDIRMQTFISLAYESLGRPQELLTRRIKDVRLADNYATIFLSDHGKEGIGILRCIDSYPYLLKLLDTHPLRDDPEAFIFLNTGNTNRFCQLKPSNINKKLRERCRLLGIKKRITSYSFKRNGVSDRRLRGDSDKDIQEVARWTSTKQLHTYDLVSQEEAYTAELIRRGLVKSSEKHDHLAPTTKQCPFCQVSNAANSKVCHQCQRLLYREDIEKEEKDRREESKSIREELSLIRSQLSNAQSRDLFIDKLVDYIKRKGKMDDVVHMIEGARLSEELAKMR
jgi:integrase